MQAKKRILDDLKSNSEVKETQIKESQEPQDKEGRKSARGKTTKAKDAGVSEEAIKKF